MQTTNDPLKTRILSADVLRGFDMFWITGGAGFFIGGELGTMFGDDFGYLLYTTVSLALTLLLVRFLYKRKIFLKL